MDRLQLVLYKAAPSQRILSRQEYVEDAQDTIHSEQKPNRMDVRGPSLRLPTPSLEDSTSGEQMVQEELVQNRHRNSDNSGAAQKRSSPTNEGENSQLPLSPAKRAVHSSPYESQEIVASTSLADAPNQQDLDPSMPLATQNEPSQHGQGYIASSAHPLNSLDNEPKSSSPLELHDCRHPTSQIPRNTTCMKDENRISVTLKAEAVSLENRLDPQTAKSAASTVDGCLCGCGGNAMRCLRPNRPPSMVDDTFFDRSLESSLAIFLKFRLKVVVRDLEPSRRIWWREEFGGCAPDRKPLASEISTRSDNDLGNVLRTSLPLFDDVTTIRNKAQDQPSRKRQRSMSLPTTPTHSQDGNGNLPQDYTCPIDNAPKSAPLYESSKKGKISTTEFGSRRPHDVRGRPPFRELFVAPKAKPLKSPTYYIPPKFPSVRYHASSKRPPIKFSELLKEPPPRPKIQEPTAEEREKRRQSAMQKIEAAGRKMRHLLATNAKRISLPLENGPLASKCDSVHQAQLDAEVMKKARNTERFQQTNQRLKHSIEAMKVRKNSHHGTALYRHDRWIPDNLPIPNLHDVGETPWKVMDPRMRLEADQGQKSMSQPLDMMKLRTTAVSL